MICCRSVLPGILAITFVYAASWNGASAASFQSHPPIRPLPSAASRPMTAGTGLYVDPKVGNDDNHGTQESPWRTIAHAVQQLKAGDVLYLRGGIYFEHVSVNVNGTRESPITIRSYPGELAVIDGGIREFFETPGKAWEPVASGTADEFRSVKTYPENGGSDGGTNVLGSFGDSMIPLHGYRYRSDLQNINEYFYRLNAGKTAAGDGIYCGPGVFYDVKTSRIHVRLAHTNQKALGDDNYRGETDPRKLPLVIAGLNAGSPLSIDDSRYLRVQDLVVRGARVATVSVNKSFNIEFDGVTAYGGSTAMAVRDSGGLRLWNCALRGIAAPWTYRGSLKYRAIEARIFSASGWAPTGADNHDFELAYSEFTDCVDGVFIGNVRNVRFHHNLLDNVSDDGIFLTATTAYDGKTHGGNVHIYQNLLSRCLTTFAFGVGHGRQKMTPSGRQTGAGVFIYRNVFDFRRPVMYTQPKEDESQITSYGRVSGDHGGPLWEPMTIYHNTILQTEPPFRGYYLAGLGGHMAGGSMRRLFNNIVVQKKGRPGNVLPMVVSPLAAKAAAIAASKAKPADPLDGLLDGNVETKKKTKPPIRRVDSPELAKLKKDLDKKSQPAPPLPIDFQADGNLHWGYSDQPTPETMFSRFRESPGFGNSKSLYRFGWTANDLVTDPKLTAFNEDWRASVDCRLESDSPAVNTGVPVPDDWPDPIRKMDRGKPDIGAIPLESQAWRIGFGGRLTVFGTPSKDQKLALAPTTFLLDDANLKKQTIASAARPCVIVQGYPAFDAPLIEFALRQSGRAYESLQRTWLDPAEYDKYGVVVVVGDLPRAKIEPSSYADDDLKRVEKFLRGGGTLMLTRGNTNLFNSAYGRKFLTSVTGISKVKTDRYDLLQPNHPWINHLDSKQQPEWINARNVQPIRNSKGETVIGSRLGLASLYRVGVGKGQLIYVGWDISASLPHGRSASTVEQETAYEQQMQILLNIFASISD